MTSPLIWSLSHPPALLGPCPTPAWVVKRPERLPQERTRPKGAVPFCLQAHPRPIGVVPHWPLLPGLVVVGVVVVATVVEVVVVTPRGRPGRGRGRGRPQPSPSLPWTPPRPSRQTTPRGSPPRTLNRADLQRRLRMLLQDQQQLAQGREIANVTMTNSIVSLRCKVIRPGFRREKIKMAPPRSRSHGLKFKQELLQRMDSLFAFYHKQWWCYRKMLNHFQALQRLVQLHGPTTDGRWHDCGSHFGKQHVGDLFGRGGHGGQRMERFKKIPV